MAMRIARLCNLLGRSLVRGRFSFFIPGGSASGGRRRHAVACRFSCWRPNLR